MYNTKRKALGNYGLHVIIFVNVGSSLIKKKCAILMHDVYKGGDYTCVGAESIWESLYPPLS